MITYQPKPLSLEDWSAKQPDNSKPVGTWYSPVEGKVPAWRRWCEGEGWSPGSYTHKYRLHNIPYCSLAQALTGEGQGKVLLLSTEDVVWELTRKFRGERDYSLRWDRVAKLCAGVEINPYQHGLRFLGWYNGWDMASGCIWKQPVEMGINQMNLDWDGSVKSWSWDDSED